MPQSPTSKPDTPAGLALVMAPFPNPSEPDQHLAESFAVRAPPIQTTTNPGQPLQSLFLPAASWGKNDTEGGGDNLRLPCGWRHLVHGCPARVIAAKATLAAS